MALIDPIAYAWAHCNPGVPFPASLGTGMKAANLGSDSEGQAEPALKRSSRKGVTYRRCPSRDRVPRVPRRGKALSITGRPLRASMTVT